MSSLEGNKIFAAIVIALMVGFFTTLIADVLVHPEPLAENAYPVDVEIAADAGGSAEPQALAPISPLLAGADIAKGEKVFKKCAACHTPNKGGAHKVGPNLWSIVNASHGAKPGFDYSSEMKSNTHKWTYEELNAFIYKPKKYMPGTKMGFAGLKKDQDRADLILYLRSLSDNPAPLP